MTARRTDHRQPLTRSFAGVCTLASIFVIGVIGAGPLTEYQAARLKSARLPDGYVVRNVIDRLVGPDGLAIDEKGRLYACIELEARVVRIDEDGVVRTVLTGVLNSEGICYVPGGHLYVGEDRAPGRIHYLNTETLEAAVLTDRFGDIEGLHVDATREWLYVAAYKWRIGTADVLAAFDTRVAARARPGGRQVFADPIIALKKDEPVPAAVNFARWIVLPVDAPGEYGVTDMAFDATATQYFGTELGSVCRVMKDGSLEVVATRLGRSEGLAFDAAGNLWIAEEAAGRVCRIDAEYLKSPRPAETPPPHPTDAGPVQVFATGLGSLEDVLVTPAGRIYLSADGLFSIIAIETTESAPTE